eukprot:1186793-Prorocentrum_minimum.AAC.3
MDHSSVSLGTLSEVELEVSRESEFLDVKKTDLAPTADKEMEEGSLEIDSDRARLLSPREKVAPVGPTYGTGAAQIAIGTSTCDGNDSSPRRNVGSNLLDERVHEDSDFGQGRRWYTAVMLSLTTTFLFADQNLMAPNLTAIAEDFGFSEDERDSKLGGQIALGFFLVGAPVCLSLLMTEREQV